jgi:hypothetical protein
MGVAHESVPKGTEIVEVPYVVSAGGIDDLITQARRRLSVLDTVSDRLRKYEDEVGEGDVYSERVYDLQTQIYRHRGWHDVLTHVLETAIPRTDGQSWDSFIRQTDQQSEA